MKVLAWCVRIALFLLVVTFSVRNTEIVEVHWLPGLQLQAPLVFVLLMAFLTGALFACLLLLPAWLKAKRAATAANKALARAEKNLPTPVPLTPAQAASAQTDRLLTLPQGPSHGI